MYVKDSNTKGFPAPLYSADFRFLVGVGDPAPILELSKEDTARLLAAYNALVSQWLVQMAHQHDKKHTHSPPCGLTIDM